LSTLRRHPTINAIAALAHFSGIGWADATALGAGLAMSSTAIVLSMLAERDLLQSSAERDSFAVLLFQDLAFIPLVALTPLLASGAAMPNHVPWLARGIIAIAAIPIGRRFPMPPLFKAIGGAKTPEVFTATALAIVAGTAFIAEAAGLSSSLGAFMAGVLLSESEYRHELQADIAPFEAFCSVFSSSPSA
jgi:Kef-type K+ transport system membrane component KefB